MKLKFDTVLFKPNKQIISIDEYNKVVHKGKIFCELCSKLGQETPIVKSKNKGKDFFKLGKNATHCNKCLYSARKYGHKFIQIKNIPELIPLARFNMMFFEARFNAKDLNVEQNIKSLFKREIQYLKSDNTKPLQPTYNLSAKIFIDREQKNEISDGVYLIHGTGGVFLNERISQNGVEYYSFNIKLFGENLGFTIAGISIKEYLCKNIGLELGYNGLQNFSVILNVQKDGKFLNKKLIHAGLFLMQKVDK